MDFWTDNGKTMDRQTDNPETQYSLPTIVSTGIKKYNKMLSYRRETALQGAL